MELTKLFIFQLLDEIQTNNLYPQFENLKKRTSKTIDFKLEAF